MAEKLLIILTTGPEDRGNRATLAFAMGVTGLINGVEVAIYMTVSGAFWSRRRAIESVQVSGFEGLATYVDQFLDFGGKIEVCSPCNEFYCAASDDEPLLSGAEVTGLSHVVDLALGASVVTL